MNNALSEIKRILLSEQELDIEIINKYLNLDYKETINIIFEIFYEGIFTMTYEELYGILSKIEKIIDNQEIDKLKIINSKVREINYRLSKLNISSIDFKKIKLILIDLNRKMYLRKEKEDNYDTYQLYYHIIFNERNIKTVELLVKNKIDILTVVDDNKKNLFINLLEHYVTLTKDEDIDYFYNVIIIFIHNLDDKLSREKDIYLAILTKHQDKKHIKDIIFRIREFGKIDIKELERKYHINSNHSKAILKETESFTFDKRNRQIISSNFITIDDKEALCLDDAISLKQNSDGSYTFYIAITDIPSLIPYHSKTFYDALSRVETLYLIDKNISMYPSIIANNLCSLLPNEYKNVIVYKYLVDPSFNLDPDSLEIIRGVIKVDNRLTYDMVDIGLDLDSETLEMLEKISLVTDILRNRNNGKEEYRRIENYIKKRADYHPSNFIDRSVSANIVQESMLLVNSSVPAFFHREGLLYMYRNHHIHNKREADILFKELMKKYKGRIPREEYEQMIKILSNAYLNAYYSTENTGHEGLGYTYYSHSSSSARRFADSYNQYLTHLQLFSNLTDEVYYRLEEEIKKVVEYINNKKRENQRFQNEYNYLCSKGKILERRK